MRPSEAQAWVTDRAQVMAPRTLRLLVTMMRSAFNAAVLDHLVPANPFARLTLPPGRAGAGRALDGGAGGRHRGCDRGPLQGNVITQAGLGLRVGELLALRTRDIDFLRRAVRIEHQIDRPTRELVAPKTPRSRRTVPLPDVVAMALAQHIEKYPPTESEFVFHTREGRSVQHDWYADKVFVPAVAKAGLPRGINTHALRHHFASVLLAAGESVIAVAERLGHDDASLVLSTYGRLLPNLEDRTRKAIDNAWSTVFDGSGDDATSQGRPQ